MESCYIIINKGEYYERPREAYRLCLVKVQLGQRLATSPILNSTFREVTNSVNNGAQLYFYIYLH